MPAFASSMPRSSLVLKNSESLVLQTEIAPHFASSMYGVPWFYRAPNLVLKNSEGLLVLGLNQTTRARSVRCECPSNGQLEGAIPIPHARPFSSIAEERRRKIFLVGFTLDF